MLRYVEKLTRRPGQVEREDVDALRAAGFSDAAIGDVAINAALFAFMNRVVDGLGGQLEVTWPSAPSAMAIRFIQGRN
ncbi:MAG TPA: hypothetical protein VGA16_05015 [Candidatus Limnocylindria bacterium]